MRIYYIMYPFNKGVLMFDCPKKTWTVFYPRKGVKARRTGEGPLSQSQTRTIFLNYVMTGKPIVHRGGA